MAAVGLGSCPAAKGGTESAVGAVGVHMESLVAGRVEGLVEERGSQRLGTDRSTARS